MEKVIEAFTGVTPEGKASLKPARYDAMLTGTGVFLALFMIGHMALVSSILLGKEFMYSVTKFLELSFIFEGGEPLFVTAAAVVVFVVFGIHGALALKKFPTTYSAFMKMRAHVKLMDHGDTTLWFYQVVTGFIMFFTASVHLYVIMSNPADIGPFASSDRIWSDWM
ncbi:MAG: fumarate reductase cytochrome b subunit, partial [Campylobacterales bacterium]|nr:fumarate reductase cytochrome b subunit [Campylobacterales bacterium]